MSQCDPLSSELSSSIPFRVPWIVIGLALALLPGLAMAACSPGGGAEPADASVDARSDADLLRDASGPDFSFPARVLRIIDGDTIEVSFQGEELTVRLKGIDCPEMQPVPEPWAEEATYFTSQHAIPAFTVGLEFDNDRCGTSPFPSTCFDVFDRMLAYIRTDTGEDLNALLVASGLARVYTVAEFERQSEYLLLEDQAQAEELGIWKP